MRKVPAAAALAWLRFGLDTLRRYPGAFLGMGVVVVILGQIPLAGTLIALLLGPALTAGVAHAAREAAAGRTPRLGQLFEAFTGDKPLGSLVALCLPTVGLIVALLLLLVFVLLGATGGDPQQLQAMTANPQALLVVLRGHLGVLLLVVLLAAVLQTMLVFFAVPRVMFDRRGAFGAMADSVRASARNAGALLSLVLALFALGIITAAVIAVLVYLPMALMHVAETWAQTILVMVLGTLANAFGGLVTYAAWRDVFGETPSDPAATGAPGETVVPM
jgi:hypothetical protein